MADEEHLKILKQGVEVWNRWRKQNREKRPDLSEAYLGKAYLSEAYLGKAYLYRSDLIEANFSGADLYGADLTEASLFKADLSGADLREANLNQASLKGTQIDDNTQIDDKWRLVWEIVNQGAVERDLSGADLSRADLSGANLREADLSGADLREANLIKADLHEVDLSGATLNGAKLRSAILYSANLSEAKLGGANLYRADLRWANLTGSFLSGADLTGADLGEANLIEAALSGVHLMGANLSGANLGGADLGRAMMFRADLSGADLSGANLSGAVLQRATLIETNLEDADLSGCLIYGISAWDVSLEGAIQSELVITRAGDPIIKVDDLEIGQFIYLLLHNEKIRHIIDTITSKVVLILGRFTPERKAILNAIRDELRRRDYLPVLFDFEKPSSRDFTETISTLAHMARFVIADITDAKSIPQELQRIVPDLPSVPVQPLIASSDYEYGMFEHIRRYPWVLDTYQYDSQDELLDALREKVIKPAEMKAKELSGK